MCQNWPLEGSKLLLSDSDSSTQPPKFTVNVDTVKIVSIGAYLAPISDFIFPFRSRRYSGTIRCLPNEKTPRKTVSPAPVARASARKPKQSARAKEADPPRTRNARSRTSESSDASRDISEPPLLSTPPAEPARTHPKPKKSKRATLSEDSDDEGEEEPEPNGDSGEENGEGESESEEEPPKKRRRTAESPNPSMRTIFIGVVMPALLRASYCYDLTPKSITISFTVYTQQEFAKPEKKRVDLGSAIMTLDFDTPYHRFLKMLLPKVARTARLGSEPEVDEVERHFQIPRLVPKHAKKAKDPNINVIVVPEDAQDTRNTEDDTSGKKKPAKKSKIPSENDIAPANSEINNKIGELRTKWTCNANDWSDCCWIQYDAAKREGWTGGPGGRQCETWRRRDRAY
ncbi:hypothetical protein R3P38DRAFT_3524472 [Favolaschia claudopus]|uniref:Uncharacterized protein n=1 Tax=Favolaschia claudopus TaxID=2862362 RepID=A0AAW0BKF2_9AGAR